MNKRMLVVIFIVILIISIVSLSACRAQRRPGPVEPSPAPMQPQESTAKAERLAQKIASLKEINSATVVLADTKAWVGVDLAANIGGRLTNEMKNEITNMVKAEDKSITTVYVTADADTVTRLRNIARDVAAGKPVTGFIDQLNEIGRRITPSAN